ncbi:MAG: long-chain fatty acid--CoA ligase [Candidatus Hermodarchaeota archaeon]
MFGFHFIWRCIKIYAEDWTWIGDWAGRRALLTPKRKAIFDAIENKRYTFAELDVQANQLARVLLDRGIQKGDRVATFAKNRVDSIIFMLATGKIGAILVPLNIRLAIRELQYMVEKTSPKVLAYDPQLISQAEQLKQVINVNHTLVMGDKPELGDEASRNLMQKVSSSAIERPVLSFDDPHLIVFTGGTTGLPKGAVLSHKLVFWNSVNTIISWGLRPDDVQPLVFPLFHTGGWNVLLTPFYHLGACSILMGDFDPGETLKIIEEEQCTIVIGVPTMFLMMAQYERFASTNFDSVRIFISGGAPCPVAIMEHYWNRNKLFKMGYGLTEVGPNNFYLPEADIKRKPTSVGFPVFHCDMKIVDNDNNPVKQGEVGELLLRGPHIFSGYWEEPKETKNTIEPDGWVHTGDLTKQDEEGFYYIVGRKKEMFISGGENVFPTEIEEIIYKHPAVDLAAVIGVPDEKWGEVGKAIVTLKKGKTATPEELREFLHGKLARYKIPKYFEIRDSMPTSAAGKILKRELT